MENRKSDITLYSRQGMDELIKLTLVNDFISLISNSSIRYSDKYNKYYVVPLRYRGYIFINVYDIIHFLLVVFLSTSICIELLLEFFYLWLGVDYI